MILSLWLLYSLDIISHNSIQLLAKRIKYELNMVANKAKIEGGKLLPLLCLNASGSNVREWEQAVQGMLKLESRHYLLAEDYSMCVDSDATIHLDMQLQVDRVIKGRRAEAVSRSNFDKAEAASEKTKVKVEGVSVKVEGAEEGPPPLEPDEEEESDDVEVVVMSKSSVDTVQARMLARAKAIAGRLSDRQDTTHTRGARTTSHFLDPLSAMQVEEAGDEESVCHVYTQFEHTYRYAVEAPEDARMRMKIDNSLISSLRLIPSHVTSGVVPGNVFDRFERVVRFYDDVGRKALMERVEIDVGSFKKRPRESFATFSSRWMDLEHRMQELKMVTEPQLLLGKLESAISSSADAVAKNALVQVKMIIGMSRSTTKELLASMAEPMRDFERDGREAAEAATRANQEKVNASWQSGGRGGGKGGGRGGKGGKNKSKGVCLDFAQGKCKRSDCLFEHKKLDEAAIAALKAKMADRRAARKAGTGAGSTPREAKLLQIVNALKGLPAATPKAEGKGSMASKMAQLRARGFGDESILEMAALLLEEN